MSRAIKRTALLLLWAGLCLPVAWPQAAQSCVRSNVAELKLRIIPDKETYSVDDKLSTATEFTNMTDTTLCFPKPSLVEEVPARGYVTSRAIGPPGTAGEGLILDRYDGGGTWPLEKLVQEIREKWVWLAPNATYVTGSTQIIAKLRTAGLWRLEATYRPPEGSFRPVEFRDYLNSAAQIVGCTIPQRVVSAKRMSVSISQ